jgi:serine protease AprX
MRAWLRIATKRAGVALVLGWMFAAGVPAAVIAPDLAAELARRAPQEEIAVIVSLADKVNPRLYELTDRRARDTRLVEALRQTAAATQRSHWVYLQNQGARELRELWAINGIAVTARASVIRQLAFRPGIERIGLDSILEAPVINIGSAAPPEWNLNAVGAPQLWALGHTGNGIVVANMDTGVDRAHPDLATRWRGGNNSWYDPHGEHPTPYDPTGHGTQTMGIMVGGSAGGSAIGLAPDARWIAAKLYNDAGLAHYSDIHLAFQWLLDPDGDLATVDAPDVVNASWGLIGSAGQCITEFSVDIGLLKTAGIAVAFAAGNDGPAPLTSLSPANNPQALSAGAVDAALAVAGFSSRGPSACDGTVYPKLVAPGVNVKTADLSFGGLPQYAVVSGTSYSAPHAAGAMAVLAEAFPGAGIGQIEAALTGTAHDLGVTGEDNSYGHGLADLQAAYQYLLAGTNSPPLITSTPPPSATVGSLYRYPVIASDPDRDALSYYLDAAPAGMVINVTTGLIEWTPGIGQVGTQGVFVRVNDARGKSATQTFVVTVAAPNQPPIAAADSYSVSAGATLAVAAPGVLANDNDADGGVLTAVLATGTASGSLSLNGNGSFSYTPTAGFAGTATFAYRAFDGALYSNNAIVSIKVNAISVNIPPVAKADSASAPMRKSTAYVPVVVNVLANDFDPDGSLDPATVSIVVAPSSGGTLAVNANGTVSYTPATKFRGKETFGYTVRDRAGGASNVATVTVTVK